MENTTLPTKFNPGNLSNKEFISRFGFRYFVLVARVQRRADEAADKADRSASYERENARPEVR